jgi:integrase
MASTRKKIRNGRVVYQAIWREPAGSDGTRRQRTRNFGKLADARAYAAKMEQEAERRSVGDPEKHTVGRYLRRWLNGLADRGEHSPSTIERYRRHVETLDREIGSIPLSRLSAADIDAAYARLRREGGVRRKGKGLAEKTNQPLSPRTVLHIHRCLSTALRQAKRWRMISENPCNDARAPRPTYPAVRAFTADEVGRLLEVAFGDSEIYAMVAILLACGLRRSELLGLAFDDVDLAAATLTVRRTILEIRHAPLVRDAAKTASSLRTVAIPEAVVDLLRQQQVRVMKARLAWGSDWAKGPSFVFPAPDGGPMNPGTLTDRLRRVMRRAGVTARAPVHAWRHTAATLLLQGGATVTTVQKRLGHRAPGITLAFYAHATAEADRAAADHFDAVLKR